METVWGWDVVWKSALILAFARLTTLAIRRSPAATRHFIWSLGTAGALALPLLVGFVPAWTWAIVPPMRAPAPAPEISPGAELVKGSEHSPPRVLRRIQDAEPAGIIDATRGGQVDVRPTSGRKGTPGRLMSRNLPANPTAWILGGWSIVSGAVLAGLCFGRLGLKRLAHNARPIAEGEWHAMAGEVRMQLGIRRRVALLRSSGASMPITWGWLRPSILLPAEADTWEPDHRRNVLLHEMAHVRRFDALTQAIAQVACAVYWFNPLAWLAASRMRVERERACDDIVLDAGVRPTDYARLLLEMARRLHLERSAGLAAVSMARPSNLEGRLRAILDPHLRRGRLGRLATALALIGLGALLLPLSALRLKAQQTVPVRGGASVSAPESRSDRTMTVTGRILDPDGKPVKGAVVDVLGRRRNAWVGATVEEEHFLVLGQGETDGDGRFRLETPRTSTTRFFGVTALGAATGFGLGWAELNPDAERPAVDIQLRLEQPIRVKLVDVTGMPAAGVEVSVAGMYRGTDDEISQGIYLSDDPPRQLRTWPRPEASDAEGRFLLRGMARDFSVGLSIRDLRYARQTPMIEGGNQAITIALEPARIIEGRVLAEDTGRPIPNAVIAAAARIQNEHANGFFTTRCRADGEGHFRINPLSSDHYTLNAFPPSGEPYLIAQDELTWSKGVVKVNHDLKLRRGVLIRGKVTEGGVGRPLAGSSVQFIPIRGGDKVLSGWQAIVASGEDGTFQVVVPPGKGHLLLFGPTSDYVLETTSDRMMYSGKPGGRRYYAHKVVAYDVKAGEDPVVEAVLRGGKTVKVRVAGPEGQSVTDAFFLTATRIFPTSPSWRGDSPEPVRDGRFELHGLAPEGTAHVDILDPVHQWGASVEVSGQQSEELTVTLEPCGRAKARFVAPDGSPVVEYIPNFEYIATPGPHAFTRDNQGVELAADAEFMANIDRKHYWNEPTTDAEGRITLPALIPGARYRINDFSTVNDLAKGVQVRRDFTVKPGETLDLGDILIEKPRG